MTTPAVLAAVPAFLLMAAAGYIGLMNLLGAMLMLVGALIQCTTRPSFTEAQASTLMISPLLPGISLLLDGRGESQELSARINLLTRLPYANFEVIVSCLNLDRGRLAALIEGFHLYKSSRVISSETSPHPMTATFESRGPVRLIVAVSDEAVATSVLMNSALAISRMPLVGCVEPGSMPIAAGLVALMRPFLDNRESPPPACSGLTLLRALDDLLLHPQQRSIASISSIIDCVETNAQAVALNAFRAPLPRTGDFVLFNRQALIKIGGFQNLPGAEVVASFVRLDRDARRSGSPRPVFVSQTVATCEVPRSIQELSRDRACRAFLEFRVALDNSAVLLRPAYGSLGLLALPWRLLGVFIPVIEVLGYILAAIGLSAGLITPMQAALFLLAAGGFGLLRTLLGLVLHLCSPGFAAAPISAWSAIAWSALDQIGLRQVAACRFLLSLFGVTNRSEKRVGKTLDVESISDTSTTTDGSHEIPTPVQV